jgi:hypothetical protein
MGARMAIRIKTSNPKGLLVKIKKAIDDGHIRTWAYDKDGDLTHTPEQYKNKAWLRPSIEEGELVLHILGNKEASPTRAIYAIYHGRFLEELLTHFPGDFDPAWPTTKPVTGDVYQL